jgi:hypothetical protein
MDGNALWEFICRLVPFLTLKGQVCGHNVMALGHSLLRPAHNLESLNSLHSGCRSPTLIEEFLDEAGWRTRACTAFKIFVGSDNPTLRLDSRNYTIFQTPIGPLRAAILPQEYANAPPEFQAHMVFILGPEIPFERIHGTVPKYLIMAAIR